jgi:CheY-like chemotaxis protein
MNSSVKILHIDPDFKVTCFIKNPGSIIRSLISLEQAIHLLKTEEFDLILSEPHNKAILKPQANSLTMGNKIRILIVDDNPTLREGLRSVLSRSPVFDIVGEAADGVEAINSVERLLPDLVLMDISMPRMDGLAATREIKKKWPDTKILVFTVHKSPEYLAAASKAGADRYLSKDSSRAELIQSIEDILDEKQGLHMGITEEVPRV